jgi:C-terminal processing protease CtpA/Prc
LLSSHWLVYILTLVAGDEILAVNGEALQGMSHAEAIAAFKRIRSGPVALRLARRHVLRYTADIM